MREAKHTKDLSGTGHRFRSDIEGLRALAVVFVLIHHAGADLLPGGFIGVDMFFVVSGFVITTQLVREVERTGTVNLPGFYARRAKRLLPAAAMVLLFTAVASWLFASRVQWSLIGTDILGAALYVVNWVFAWRSVDYLAEDVEPSPVQHFWSLAVEEQFYFIWPILIIGLALGARLLARRRLAAKAEPFPLRTVLAVGLVLLVVLPSLAWSIYYTIQSPAEAYFVTTTRLWELGIGALAAVLAPKWKGLSARAADGIAWAGLALLGVSLIVIDLQTSWPGSAALLPTLATVLVLIGGFNGSEKGPGRILGVVPLVWIGGLSYSLYLWHWPILRAGEWIIGDFSPIVGLGLVSLTVLPAWAGYHLVEKPFRYSKALSTSSRFSLSMGANFTLVGVVAGLILSTAAGTGQAASGERTTSEYGLGSGPNDTPLYSTITPDPAVATEDVPDLYARGCQVNQVEAGVGECVSRIASEGTSDVAVVGDSKIAQWLPALEEIGAEQGWQVTSYTKSSCSFSTAVQVLDREPYDSCTVWNEELATLLSETQPDVVITSGLVSTAFEGSELTERAAVDGYVEAWSKLAGQDIPIIVLSDTPSPDSAVAPVYECVAANPDDANDVCSWDSSDGSPALSAAAGEVPMATYLDINQFVCPEGVCYPVYRNVLTYRQGSHITATFALLLEDSLAGELIPAVTEGLTLAE